MPVINNSPQYPNANPGTVTPKMSPTYKYGYEPYNQKTTNYDYGTGIYAPERTTMADAYGSIQNLLPNGGVYDPITYTGVEGLGDDFFGDDYWNSMLSNAEKSLNEQYFGKEDSLQNRFTTTMNQRGMLGTGVEAGGIGDLYSDFGSKLADVQGEVGRLRTEKDYDRAKLNKEIEQTNAAKALETAVANKEGALGLSELGLSAAGDESLGQTEYDTDIYGSNIELEKILADIQQGKMDSATALIGDEKIDPDDREAMLEYIFQNLY